MAALMLQLVIGCLPLVICEAAKILTITPFPMKSHEIAYKPLMLELARRGHNVTSIGAYPTAGALLTDETVKNNYREIIFESEYKTIFGKMDHFEIRRKTTLLNMGWRDLFEFWSLTDAILQDVYSTPGVKMLIENSNEEKFDLIICEGFFGFESLFAFGELFRSPVIVVYTFGPSIYTNQYIGNPLAISYYPNFLSPYSDKMDFAQRLHNFLLNGYILVATHLFHLPNQDRLAQTYFKNAIKPREMPPVINLLTEASLVFVNSHISLGYARPNVPNVIEVGGLHIRPEANKTFHEDVQALMDNAREGVVYFSLGSNVDMAAMPDKYTQAFAKTFSQMPQLILWKRNRLNAPNQCSPNVHFSEWYPQQQILAHKNCVAFITHGGMLSLEEAVYYGVPVLGIPFFGDQPMNMKLVDDRKFGVMLELDNITHESLSWSLREIIDKPVYKETAKHVSSIFRDSNSGNPLEKAVYWVEYVLRYNGAPHLRTHARLLPYYKYLLLDVILVTILILILLFYITYLLIKLLLYITCLLHNQNMKNKKD